MNGTIIKFTFSLLAIGGANVIFDGRAIPAASMPDAVPKSVRETALKLDPWAEKYHLQIHVAANNPLLVVLPANYTSAPQINKKLHDVREDFIARFEGKTGDASMEVVYVDKQAAYTAYVDLLVSREDYLKSWAAGAKENVGFTLLRPFATAYFRDPKDPKEKKAEFNLMNELEHQYAHVLVNAAFGRQPYWVQETIAWSLEQGRENQIYAFCHRNGFVAKKEHGGWPKLGKQYLLSAKSLPFDKIFAMERDADIPRELAAGSMVFMELLSGKNRESLLKLIAAFKAEYESKASDPSYKIPLDKQKSAFKESFGDDANVKLIQQLSEGK
ncbi:MAG: hypothetical protein HY286_08655 [Planctomycetes bacterium]|nr:hypothetical protein [Planctomycetota bacterium]